MVDLPSGTNNRNNPYYLKPNHIKIAKEVQTKAEYLGGGTPAVLSDLALSAQVAGDVTLTYTIDKPSNVTGVWTSSNTKPLAEEVTGGTATDQIGSNFTELFDGSAVNTPLPSGHDGTAYLWLVPAGGSIVYPVSGSISTSFDTVAPTLSNSTATKTGSTTADWTVTSNEAGGTIFSAARLSTDGVLSRDNIENGTGNAVATSTDASPTADANNGGSFTGLTASTTYVVDMFHRDAQGNESAIETSPSFTTDAGSSWSVSSSTGATNGTDGSYTWYEWTGDGDITFGTAPSNVEIYLVGGGGGGGSGPRSGGGGAGGEVKTVSTWAPADSQYDIVVGPGGAGGAASTGGTAGTASSVTLNGGAEVDNAAGGPGGGAGGGGGTSGWNGSGGGGVASDSPQAGGTGTGGNDGGDGNNRGSGGGGGAGGAGQDRPAINQGGDGGLGVTNNWTGSTITVSAGGGGGSDGTGGTGGAGGSSGVGGDGGDENISPTAGDANTGSGGGGTENTTAPAGAGGSGRVILRWLT